ncbi:hypothetical protein J3458_021279 [Metarhizium acridum]|uniref:uncharacterized protein n=1 Tax=Metarhizium acridum TaxID=92637 RepID=UPI001C6CDE9B|nr:hypothetical protein J3458_021279 [Metarhizium acridum]
MVGWHERSWGYRGDEGQAFAEGRDADYDAKYDENAVIGCGINFDEHIAFYTRDEVVLVRAFLVGKAFTDIKGKLYPAVSVDECMVGSRVSTKFWVGETTNFMYKGSLTAPGTLTRP